MSDTVIELNIVHHDGREEVRSLAEGTYGIGRSADNWLAPLDTALSRNHSRIDVKGAEVWIEGLPSRNGTLVNGGRIDRPTLLGSGDEVRVGRTVLRVVVRSASGERRRTQATIDLPPGGLTNSDQIVVRSTAMVELLGMCDRFARGDLPVLVTGESGTGKELLARRIHTASARRGQPFVVLNCPALADGVMATELFGVEAGVATGVSQRKGKLEDADGGTLFLDEIADLSRDAQAMLLRFLQDGNIERVGGRNTHALDVRVVAATHRDLKKEIEDGAFRHDLFYRIATLQLEIPALRDRPEDLDPLVEHFFALNGARHLHLSDGAMAALRQYAFPGNVRELAAIIARASILVDGSLVEAGDLHLAGAETETETDSETDRVSELVEGVVAGELDFWDEVYRPFLDRDLSRATVRAVVAKGLERSGGNVRELASYFNVGKRYRKLLDFLRNNRLMP